MKVSQLLPIISILSLFGCGSTQMEIQEAAIKYIDNQFTLDDYIKKEVFIEMRDGAKLYTAIYTPKDTSQLYPIMIKRTPYGCSPYGDTISPKLSHNADLIASGYIFVYQDMRGRWMSEGTWENVRPPYSFDDESATDEVTDSYDTFEWLEDSLQYYNGKAGVYGNSYLGWSTLVAGVSNHPTLKAIMPMAPVTNFYFEDFSRYGICAMNYFPILNAFGIHKQGLADSAWYTIHSDKMGFTAENDSGANYYDWFLDRFTTDNFADIIDSNNFFWNNISAHPNYDEHHQKRDWIQYLDKIECPTIVVGGWNDEQNLYGIINSFKKISQTNPNVKTVLGPWTHGHNQKHDSLYYMGDIFYGAGISDTFQTNIELAFFEHHLKGREAPAEFTVRLFDTGNKEWLNFDKYPTVDDGSTQYFVGENGSLAIKADTSVTVNYVSDPFTPVPFVNSNKFVKMAPKRYMTEDQRFVEGRKDVLTFKTPPLEDDLTVVGTIKALLQFSTTRKDADLYVKIIDQYPQDREPEENDLEGVNFKGYAQTVRIGYIRGRFRSSFETPEKFIPREKTEVNVPLLDICHTFKKGHRIMIQIQSSMFPLMELNPQNWVESIYNANKEDFSAATHTIWGDTKFIFPVQGK